MDVEIAHRHREEVGKEGVLATPAFPAIAIGAVAGVEVDIDAVGFSVLGLSPVGQIKFGAIEGRPCFRDVIPWARQAILQAQVSKLGMEDI